MDILLSVILPVFLLIGFGYGARIFKLIDDDTIDAVLSFAQTFAVPTLLFAGIVNLDLSKSFETPVLYSFYTGAIVSGLVTALGARYLFGRVSGDVIAIGFIGMFSNSLLIGVPITERAYGAAALEWNYVILSIHAALLFAIGICAMEITRARGQGLSLAALTKKVIRSTFRNPLIIGISLGWIVNLTGIPLPDTLMDAVFMMNKAAIPAALFALGGVLYRYRPEGDLRVALWAVSCSIVLHPALTYGLGTQVFSLSDGALRSATITAAVAPGVNTYMFAHMYGVAKRVAASSVLIGTALCMFTVWVWLLILP